MADPPGSEASGRGPSGGPARGPDGPPAPQDRPAPWFDSLACLVALLDRDGQILQINRACEEATGFLCEEVAGKAFWQLIVFPKEAEALRADFEARPAGGPSPPRPVRCFSKSGDFRMIEWSFASLPGEDGAPRRVLASGTDITERESVETALRESQRRLAKAQALARIGYWGWSLGSEGMYYVSQHYTDILGLPPDQVPKRQADFNRFLHPEDRERVAALFESVMRQPRDYEIEYRIVRPDGEVRHVVEIGELTTDEIGRPNGHTGTLQDVTTLKQAERALVSAKQEAERASRAKSEFLANMSHELRTPLNVIIGFAELMETEKLGPIGNPAYREHAGQIRGAGDHLLALISDVLDMSRVEAGSLRLQEEELDVRDIIHSSIQLAGRRLSQKSIDLRVEVPEDLPGLHGDERRLKQILINLLSNAFKFTPAGGRVTVDAVADPAGGFRIRVGDTGIGMAADDIPKALARFGQVDGSLTRDFNGTGLGLPLSKALVEMHGGTLALESALGAGTTVTLHLPAARVVWRGAARAAG